MAHSKPQMLLPQIVSRKDLGRVLRELESINETLLQLELRHPGQATKLPGTSAQMDILIEANKMNILKAEERDKLKAYLSDLISNAPIIHLSFSADPKPAFLESVASWFRQEVHPVLLIDVGLAPNIGLGCIVRTPNHYIDLSLKEALGNSKTLLSGYISGSSPKAAESAGVEA